MGLVRGTQIQQAAGTANHKLMTLLFNVQRNLAGIEKDKVLLVNLAASRHNL
jgi:hypothetical protein